MNTWIFQGNPTKFDIDNYLLENETIWWSIRQAHFADLIELGDEVFIWRSDGVNKGSGGIVARTQVIGNPQEYIDEEESATYWYTDAPTNPYLAVELKVQEVDVEQGVNRMDLKEHDILSNLMIMRLRQNTNYLVEEEHTIHLKQLWQDSIGLDTSKEELLQTILEDFAAEEVESGKVEGNVKTYYGKRYERNPENRQRAIEIHGLDCYVCGFNFEAVYGERGANFIEVHHLKPLSTLEEATEINPDTDLVPLCANCHRMIHRRKDAVLTVADLKAILRKS